jgi:hypothetical protein
MLPKSLPAKTPTPGDADEERGRGLSDGAAAELPNELPRLNL